MTEKEVKILAKSIDGLTKAVEKNSKKIDMYYYSVLHQTRVMANTNGFDIDDAGQLVDVPCPAPIVSVKLNQKK